MEGLSVKGVLACAGPAGKTTLQSDPQRLARAARPQECDAPPVRQGTYDSWEQRLGRLEAEWARLRPPPLPPWSFDAAEHRMAAMLAERQDIVRAGQWLGGPATVLEALGLARDELSASRLLGWLLRPDGRHRLHEAPLRHLLSLVGAECADGTLDPVRVVLEESRETVGPADGDPAVTRADIVVYTRRCTLVVEAKVYAPEQRNQLDRLKRTWRDSPAPAFLFVTRRPTLQLSSTGEGPWPAVTWRELAEGLAVACPADAPAEVPAVLNSLRSVR